MQVHYFNVDLSHGMIATHHVHTNVDARGAMWSTQLSKRSTDEMSRSYPGLEMRDLIDNDQNGSIVAFVSKEVLCCLAAVKGPAEAIKQHTITQICNLKARILPR